MSDSQGRARESLYWRNATKAFNEGRYLDAARWEVLAQWQQNRNTREREREGK